MDKKIAIVGHIDHSKTTLTEAIVKVLSEQENKIHILSEENEPVFYDNVNHRTRKRKQERKKQKIKNKYKGNRNLFKK